MKYHAGELKVQARAGVQEAAGKVSGVMRSTVPARAQTFLREQRMLVASSIDANGRVWASLLTGDPGFINIPDEKTVRIAASTAASDPLVKNLVHNAQIGLLAIEFATRRRAKLKGKAEIGSDGNILVRLDRVYSLCPKYIQAREPTENPNAGLLFLDFQDGRILQLSGKAEVIWDPARIGDFVGAERLVAFEVEEVRETADVFPPGWQFLGYSPFNPKSLQ